MRVATWNLKQAVAPRKPLPELWGWLETAVGCDVAVLTEAKVPKSGPPAGWTALWDPEGIGPRRRWGTVIAARGVEVRPVTEVGRLRKVELAFPWPAVVQVADVMKGRDRWATLVGLYGLTVDHRGESCGHGGFSVPTLLECLEPLLESSRGDRLVLAGDFNLWPNHLSRLFADYGLIDVVEHTAHQRPPLENCANCNGAPGCGHLWTHRNGNSPGAAVQQIDFICVTEGLTAELSGVYGGVGAFPDAWSVSDHAPVVAEFRR